MAQARAAGACHHIRDDLDRIPQLEAGIGVSHALDEDSEIQSNSIGVFSAFYPIKQTEALPLSIRVGTSYAYSSLSGGLLDEEGVDGSASTTSVFGSIHHAVDATPNVQIIPFAEVGYLHQSVTVEARFFGDTVSETVDDNAVYYGLGGSLLLRTDGATVVVITPSLTFSEGDPSFGASLTILFP